MPLFKVILTEKSPVGGEETGNYESPEVFAADAAGAEIIAIRKSTLKGIATGDVHIKVIPF